MLRRSAVLFAVVGCLAAFGVAGCGSSSSSSTAPGGGTSASGQTTTGGTSFAKTKFVFHTGLAIGAFHHWIYKPFKAGVFSHALSHKLAIVKAALAALFTYHELKLAYHDAQSSKLLRPLVAPISFVITKVNALAAKIKGGQTPASADVSGVESGVGSITSAASAAGAPITEAIPSATQLATGVAQ
jgi:hypothetical protein